RCPVEHVECLGLPSGIAEVPSPRPEGICLLDLSPVLLDELVSRRIKALLLGLGAGGLAGSLPWGPNRASRLGSAHLAPPLSLACDLDDRPARGHRARSSEGF